METLKEFDLFIQFCLEHGGTLRNHKAFGEMASKLRMKIEALEKNQDAAAPEENPDQLSMFNRLKMRAGDVAYCDCEIFLPNPNEFIPKCLTCGNPPRPFSLYWR